MQIEIKDSTVETFSGTAKATGKPYNFHRQTGWLHGIDAYPVKFQFSVPSVTAGFAVGVYELDIEKSVYVDKNRNLAIQPVLKSRAGK